jgi:hypothetical protein
LSTLAEVQRNSLRLLVEWWTAQYEHRTYMDQIRRNIMALGHDEEHAAYEPILIAGKMHVPGVSDARRTAIEAANYEIED